MQVTYSKRIIVKTQYSDKFTLKDVMIIGGIGFGVGFVTFLLFPTLMAILETGGVVAIAYFLLQPSGVPERKNYQTLVQILRKPSRVYRAVDVPKNAVVFKRK
ncbi:hypothetical protein [Lacticaseibacillus sharpeae]|uniref:hypothetical protein n=1 Tax=Lacticaseibacillus sharpeae TaxID=1626 RepID=UPI0006D1DBF6|nr:hypothetical protein [Lacticaseibacillus sharpeae]